jgi:hypothetical protein
MTIYYGKTKYMMKHSSLKGDEAPDYEALSGWFWSLTSCSKASCSAFKFQGMKGYFMQKDSDGRKKPEIADSISCFNG